MTTFSDFGLAAPILTALAEERHVTPTPIQVQAIPQVIAGRDLLGIAQTGTGKTAAFALPILHHLSQGDIVRKPRNCRVLVLSPTRELCGQIQERFGAYGRQIKTLRTALVIGGVPIGRQIRTVTPGVDVLVATPGRLLDLVEQRALQLGSVEILVVDEADQMLDMGFIHALRKILTLLPKTRQTLFFSATMPPAIDKLASQMLSNPAKVSVTPVAKTADRVDQHVIFVDSATKSDVLARVLSQDGVGRALVFTRTKRGADKVVRGLEDAGIAGAAIHGNKSQPHRERALSAFRNGAVRVLVATDIAARGIDVDSVSHVVNFDLPNVPETYVHRIGRTARAGASGMAISLCAPDDRSYVKSIERLIRQPIPVMAAPGGVVLRGQAKPAAANGSGGEPTRNQRTPDRNDHAGDRRHRPARQTDATQLAHQREARPQSRAVASQEAERTDIGKGRTSRVRRRRNRGPAGRELSRASG